MGGGVVDGAEGINTWMHKMPSCYTVPTGGAGGEFRFRDDEYEVDDRDSTTFMSWHLNVTDRPGHLLHDLTRY